MTGPPAGSSDSHDAAHLSAMTDPGLFATAPGSSSLDQQQESDSEQIIAMDFCERSRFLSLVLGDGSVALCVASQDGSSPLRELSLARWVCGAGSGACIARIGATAQLLAVGKVDGVVDLYRSVETGWCLEGFYVACLEGNWSVLGPLDLFWMEFLLLQCGSAGKMRRIIGHACESSASGSNRDEYLGSGAGLSPVVICMSALANLVGCA